MNVLEKGKFFHPEFFRTLVDQEEEFLDDLETVLSGNLQLDSSAMAGIGRYDDHFFCASLSDEELPVSLLGILIWILHAIHINTLELLYTNVSLAVGHYRNRLVAV